MSATPRTDARRAKTLGTLCGSANLDLAEDIETELADAKRHLESVTQSAKDNALNFRKANVEIAELNARVKELEKTEEFYKASMVKIAKEFGIDSPLQLIARATDDSQTYADILLLVIQESKRTAKADAFEEAAEMIYEEYGVATYGGFLRTKAASIRKGELE